MVVFVHDLYFKNAKCPEKHHPEAIPKLIFTKAPGCMASGPCFMCHATHVFRKQHNSIGQLLFGMVSGRFLSGGIAQLFIFYGCLGLSSVHHGYLKDHFLKLPTEF